MRERASERVSRYCPEADAAFENATVGAGRSGVRAFTKITLEKRIHQAADAARAAFFYRIRDREGTNE